MRAAGFVLIPRGKRWPVVGTSIEPRRRWCWIDESGVRLGNCNLPHGGIPVGDRSSLTRNDLTADRAAGKAGAAYGSAYRRGIRLRRHADGGEIIAGEQALDGMDRIPRSALREVTVRGIPEPLKVAWVEWR